MNSIPILYENNEIFIINKPSGVSVQGGEKISHPLDEELAKQTGGKVYLVHRLDRDTSGLLVVARSSAAAAKWAGLLAGGKVRKEYKALCIGRPPASRGTITASILEKGVGKTAVTYYDLQSSVRVPVGEKNAFVILSLLHLTLGTGRMHQIRIHLAQAGCPIAGDDRHGDFRLNRVLRRCAGIRQLMLTAFRLTLPIDTSVRTFEIPLPDHMDRVVKKIWDSGGGVSVQ